MSPASTSPYENADIPIRIEATNTFYVPEQGLGAVLAGTQAVVEKTLQRSLDKWKTNGGISLNFLLSPGGLGKSFVVGRLRKEWQSQGFREVVLDGETVSDDVRLVQRTFAILFPFPKSPFDDSAKPALEQWLKGLNLSPEACETLAADFLAGRTSTRQLQRGPARTNVCCAPCGGQRARWSRICI